MTEVDLAIVRALIAILLVAWLMPHLLMALDRIDK